MRTINHSTYEYTSKITPVAAHTPNKPSEDPSKIIPVPASAPNHPRLIYQVKESTLRHIEQEAIRQTKFKSILSVKCPICKVKIGDKWRHRIFNTSSQFKEQDGGSGHLKY